jgi:hypothetical protein
MSRVGSLQLNLVAGDIKVGPVLHCGRIRRSEPTPYHAVTVGGDGDLRQGSEAMAGGPLLRLP